MDNRLLEEQIRALTRISKAITSEKYLDDILRQVVHLAAEVLGSTICSLMLIDEKSGELLIKATQSISDAYNTKEPLKVGEGIAGRVAKLNQPVAVRDVQKEKEYKYKDIARKEKLRSLLSVPMAVQGKVIGVLNCYTCEPHDFTETETNLLTAIANQAAVAIVNAELALKARTIQQELESRKVVERAKGIVMRDQGLSEEQAYLHIRKYSMDNRKTMKEVAEAIIMAEEMKKKF